METRPTSNLRYLNGDDSTMRKLQSATFRDVSIIRLFRCYLLVLCVSSGSVIVAGCASKESQPNQTLLNRPTTVIVDFYEDFRNHPIDPQITSVWTIRPVRYPEYTAYALGDTTMWVRTADVIKPITANWLADYGMPTGRWRKMDFDWYYVCFSEPLNIKGNVIRYRVKGGREGGMAGEHQLTLTVNNHDTLQEAKRAFLEKVAVLYKHIDWNTDMEPVIRHRILNEHFVYSSDDQTVPGQFRDADSWQPAPTPNFKYHSFEEQRWVIPFDYDGGMYNATISILREPLSENGYKWGDPFAIRVIFKPYIPE